MAETSLESESADAARRRAKLIDAALLRSRCRLRFEDTLEARFERQAGPERCRIFIRYGFLGFILCNMFLPSYFALLPDIAWREVFVQCAIMSPLALAVIAYMRTQPPVLHREASQVCIAVLGLVAPIVAYQGSIYPAAVFFRYAPLLTLLYVNVVVAVRFRFALPASALTVLCNVIDLWRLDGVSADLKHLVGTAVLATCGFTLLANHRLEREQRRTYLLNEREGLQRDEIIRLADQQALEATQRAQEREEAAHAAAEHAAELRDAHRIARVATWRRDIVTGSLAMSDELHQLLGTDPHSFASSVENLLCLVHPEDRATVADAFSRATTGDAAIEQEWRATRPDGSPAWFWSEMHLETDAFGRPVAVRGVCKDVTEDRAAAERISRLAHHDALTGLVVRSRLRELFIDAIAKARSVDGELTVFCLDLDGFKAVNDVHGHAAGDRLLCEVAARLSRAVGDDDIVARLGGDEFVVVQTRDVSCQSARSLAEHLVETLGAPYNIDIGSTRACVTASVGIARFPADGAEPEVLIRNADLALYRAKRAGKSQAVHYRPEMDRELRERRDLESDLVEAASRNEFSLAWQPLAAATGDAVLGFEVLLRWHHPERDAIPPNTFIPLAEACGAIVAVGAWVLREACREAAGWGAPLRVAVNVSPVQVQQGETFARLVEEVLASTGLAPHRLVLEVTEGVLIRDTVQVLVALRRLKALGVLISLDDFGTGYSSLATLRTFPFDQIKIDHSFVAGIRNAPAVKDMAIIQAVVDLARGLDVPVVAEGVETDMQLQYLRNAGCQEVQGWLVGRPAPISDFADITDGRPGSSKLLVYRCEEGRLQAPALA